NSRKLVLPTSGSPFRFLGPISDPHPSSREASSVVGTVFTASRGPKGRLTILGPTSEGFGRDVTPSRVVEPHGGDRSLDVRVERGDASREQIGLCLDELGRRRAAHLIQVARHAIRFAARLERALAGLDGGLRL